MAGPGLPDLERRSMFAHIKPDPSIGKTPAAIS